MHVTIYSTPVCHFCKEVKDFLKEKGVEYEDINVLADLEARKVMVDKSGQLGVPVVVIGDEVVVGFNREKLEKLLASEV